MLTDINIKCISIKIHKIFTYIRTYKRIYIYTNKGMCPQKFKSIDIYSHTHPRSYKNSHVCMFVWPYKYEIFVCTFFYVCTFLCNCMFVCLYICIIFRMCSCVCFYYYIFLCMCRCMCVYACMRLYTYLSLFHACVLYFLFVRVFFCILVCNCVCV